MCLVLPFIVKGVQTGSPGEEGSSLDTGLGYAFHQGRSSQRWREVLQGQGGQGRGQRRIPMDPLLLQMDTNDLAMALTIRFLCFPTSLHSFSMSPFQGSAPALRLHDAFCDNPIALTRRSLCECVSVCKSVLVCFSSPVSSELIVLASVPTVTLHCDSLGVHNSPRTVSLWSLSLSYLS